jgi:hypothetical protein
LAGTQPGGSHEVDQAGLLYSQSCGTWVVDPVKAELGPRSWDDDVRDWLARARRGPGATGRFDSTTAFFWHRTGWGGPLAGACVRRVTHVEHHGKTDQPKGGKPKGEKPPADKPKGPGGKPPKP